MHVVQIVTATVAVALVCALGRAGRVRVWNTMSSVFMFSCGRAFNDATHNFDAILIGPFCIVYAQSIAVLWLVF